MKLITNYKDYYDFQIGKYGIDEKAVYNRVGYVKPQHLQYPDRTFSYFIAFCGILYCIYYHNRKFYYGDECNSIHRVQQPYDHSLFWKDTWQKEKSISSLHTSAIDINEKENQPVLLVTPGAYRYLYKEGISNIEWEVEGIPVLSQFGFPALVSPEDCFIQITNFLLRDKTIVDNRTDKEKIVSKGFDVITSFRKM